MRVLTLNCHGWQEENQLEKIKYLAKTIKERDFDVIALQEVSQSITSQKVDEVLKEDNYMLLLLKALNEIESIYYHSVWDFVHITSGIYEEGISILSKYPIIQSKSFFVTQNNDPGYWNTRKALQVTIQYQERLVDLLCTHLSWWENKDEPFSNQIKNINENINWDRLSFLLGDFNNSANKRNEGYDYIVEKGWMDTYHLTMEKDDGITVKGKITGWENNKEDLRLDMILVNKKIKIKSSKTIFNGINTKPVSDHYGVEVEIIIR